MRLTVDTGKNSPTEYDKIYFQRKALNEVDTFDLKRWRKLLKYYEGGKLLDMGCLDSLCPSLAKQQYPNAEVWGIDLAEAAITDMQERFPDVVYAVDDVYKTKFPRNYFDYIIAGEVIEHLENPKRFVSEVMRILKHGGIFALSTPLEEHNEPGAVDAERHLWSWSEEELTDMLKPFGKVITRTLGSQYFPYYQYHWPNLIVFLFKK